MARVIPGRIGQGTTANTGLPDYAKQMSDHVAWALLVYTGLQILVTMQAIKMEGSILPYFGLIVLVAAIIPACRRFEARWEAIAADLPRSALRNRFARDCVALWLLAIGLPFLVTGLAKLLFG